MSSPIHPAIGLDHAIRNARRVWFFASYAWLFGAFMLVMGVLIAAKAGSFAGALAGVAFGLAIALPAIWFGARMRRAELRIGPGSVVVRNPIRSVTASLNEVDEFQAGSVTPNATNPTPGIVVRLKSGRELPVWALAEESSIFSAKRKTGSFEPLADDLNTLLADARSRGHPRA